MQLTCSDSKQPGLSERRQLLELYMTRAIMEGIAAKMTSLHRTSVKRQKSVYSVDYQTLLIIGCISAPSEVYVSFATLFSVHYSYKSRSVGSRVHYNGGSATSSNLFCTQRMSQTEYGQRTGHAIKKRNWLNAVTGLSWQTSQRLISKASLDLWKRHSHRAH